MPGRSSRTPIPVMRTPQGAGVQVVEQPAVRRLAGALELPVAQIRHDEGQPRHDWKHDEGEQRLDELARSIREFGVLQPLLVGAETAGTDGAAYYPLIAGNRRLVAARRAGLATVPALVRDAPATQVRVLQLTENLQRQDLAPLDEANAYKELMDLEQLSAPQLAARLHLSETQVRNRLHLLDDQVLADAVARRQIAASTARQVLQLPDEERARFRDRVAAGERIQINDLAVTRARLRAEGVPHPRRTPRPALPLAQPMPLVAVPERPADGTMRLESLAPAGVPAPPVPATDRVLPQADRAAPEIASEHRLPAGVDATTDGAPGPAPGIEGARDGAAPAPDGLAQLVASADPRALAMLRQFAHYGEARGVDPRVLPLATRLLGQLLREGIAADLSCRALFATIWGDGHG